MITHHSKVDISISKDLGNKSQIPFVFLHGFTGSSESWSHITSKIDHPYITIDLPGHGKSMFRSLSSYTFNHWTSDLKQILDEMEVHQIKLCGYSMGGRLAAAFIEKYPEMVKEIFIESSHMGIDNIKDRDMRLVDDLNLVNKIKNEFNLFISDWSAMDMFKMQKKRNITAWRLQNSIRLSQDSKQLSMALDFFSLGRMPICHQYIKKGDIPIHFINGIEDYKYIEYSKSLYKLNNNIIYHIIDDAYHNVHLENSSCYINIIDESMRYDL